MLSWIIQIAIISLIFIFLIHHLIIFLTSTLTIPKIKDLVDSPTKKYENIFNIISNNSNSNSNPNPNFSYTDIDLLPSAEPSSMKDELKSFLKTQLNNNNISNSFQSDTTGISEIINSSTEENSFMGLIGGTSSSSLFSSPYS
jgi:hypothetical protein